MNTPVRFVDGYPVDIALRQRYLFAIVQSASGRGRECRKCHLIKPIEAFHHTENDYLKRRKVCGVCRNWVNVA